MKRTLFTLLLLLSSLQADYFTDARSAYHNGNYKGSISILDEACSSGIADACFVLGVMYDTAEVVEQDLPLAVALYTEACDGSVSDACARLGTFYFMGIGVTKDRGHGKELYAKACENGQAEACIHLGHIYENSDNIEEQVTLTQRRLLPTFFNYDEDIRKAKILYSKACDLGSSRGCLLYKQLNYLGL